MPLKHTSRDQIAAVGVIVFGAAFAAISHGYPQGTLLRPGPGFLPFYIGLLMVLLGGLIVVENLKSPQTDDAETPGGGLRPVLAISGAIVVLALLLERLGFIPALAAMFLCIGFAERGQGWRGLLAVCVFMAVFGTLLFIWGLGVPIPVFGAS